MQTNETVLTIRERAKQKAIFALDMISDLLQDPKSSPSVRLRAALAILKLAAAPEPKSGRTSEDRLSTPQPSALVQQTEIPAQSTAPTTVRRAPEPGRNTICPCGSGLKYKRCCAQKSFAQTAQPVGLCA